MYIEQQLTYDELFTFLVPHLESEGWTIHRNEKNVLIAETQLGGCIILSKDFNESTGTYNVFLDASTSYEPDAEWYDQPNSIRVQTGGRITDTSMANLTQATFAKSFYGFFNINPRRLIISARNGIYYQSSYIGRFLPYSSPSNYEFPMIVCGNMCSDSRASFSTNTASEVKYDRTENENSNYGTYSNSGITPPRVLEPTGVWSTINKNKSSDHAVFWPDVCDRLQNWGSDIDGKVTLWPQTIISSSFGISAFSENGAHLGVLDGVYKISGDGISPESIVTQGSVEHICLPNVYRSGRADLIAIAKE